MQIQVYQGEREIASHNKLLGSFELGGIAPAPQGVPQIEVTFDIDANGIVHVTARTKGTGKEQHPHPGRFGPEQDDIDRMIKDAEAHADDDRKRREEAETHNQAESLVHHTEKFLKDNDDKVSAELRTRSTPRSPRPTRALKAPTSAPSRVPSKAVGRSRRKWVRPSTPRPRPTPPPSLTTRMPVPVPTTWSTQRSSTRTRSDRSGPPA